jgi:hypothetical protein
MRKSPGLWFCRSIPPVEWSASTGQSLARLSVAPDCGAVLRRLPLQAAGLCLLPERRCTQPRCLTNETTLQTPYNLYHVTRNRKVDPANSRTTRGEPARCRVDPSRRLDASRRLTKYGHAQFRRTGAAYRNSPTRPCGCATPASWPRWNAARRRGRDRMGGRRMRRLQRGRRQVLGCPAAHWPSQRHLSRSRKRRSSCGSLVVNPRNARVTAPLVWAEGKVRCGIVQESGRPPAPAEVPNESGAGTEDPRQGRGVDPGGAAPTATRDARRCTSRPPVPSPILHASPSPPVCRT